MADPAVSSVNSDSIEAILREDLARGVALSASFVPILRNLLANGGNFLFSDEVIASMRGMISDVARQLLEKVAEVSGETEKEEYEPEEIAALFEAFTENSAFVCHVHALALEWQFTHRLQAKLGLDPVSSPLLQSLIAKPDEPTAGLAMKLLAAQARFCQQQRRMQLPLYELPGDLLHGVLVSLRNLVGAVEEADQLAAGAEERIRAGYDEAASRLGLISRLIVGLGGDGAAAALSLNDAGAAIFLTALAIGSGQERDGAVFSTDEGQAARLALALRAAGLDRQGIEEQMLALHPDVCLPDGLERLSPDRAAAILSLGSCQGQ